MTDKSSGQRLLENAYKLSTPDDHKTFYDEFASSYDADFASALGYRFPKAVAATYQALATDQDQPIADIGCGTGLVAEALGGAVVDIDGIDISDAMLAASAAKGLYRATIKADLTGPLEALGSGYGAVISAGTFTSGHLGPTVLAPLLGIAKAGALFVIGVNKAHFLGAGFEPVMTDLADTGRIRSVEMAEIPIYDRAGHDHSADQAYVLSFRKP